MLTLHFFVVNVGGEQSVRAIWAGSEKKGYTRTNPSRSD